MGNQSIKNQIVWFDIPCIDLDRAIAFYSAVLGCQVEKQSAGPDFDLGVLPHVDNSVGGCLVVGKEHFPSDRGVLVYLNCQDRLDEAIVAATSHGGRVLEPKTSIAPHGWRAVVEDSEGNRVALHSM